MVAAAAAGGGGGGAVGAAGGAGERGGVAVEGRGQNVSTSICTKFACDTSL